MCVYIYIYDMICLTYTYIARRCMQRLPLVSERSPQPSRSQSAVEHELSSEVGKRGWINGFQQNAHKSSITCIKLYETVST